jgi:hypothetical protein
MKPVPLGTINAHLPALEEDLAIRMAVVFDRCPALHGFSVQDRATLPYGSRAAALECNLYITEVGIHPELGEAQRELIYDEIAVALLDLLFTRPEAARVLRGRTFARTRH